MTEYKKIDGRAKTVRELLNGAKYTIDFYQREYAWQERQVTELLDDLTGKFLDFYEPGHDRHEVEKYGHYFLGSIVVSHKRGQKFIVDGQQRLTTLTLLLIYLHHKARDAEGVADVRDLIFAEKYGKRSFNLDVPDRVDCMNKLFGGDNVDPEGLGESVKNLAARYQSIVEQFPDDVAAEPLPYFVDWLLENVHLVEIEAYSDEDAYTIFETMNDRGLSLSLPEMLKGYVLANVTQEPDQRKVNDLWKKRMQSMRDIGPEEDVDFFKSWLRARHADTARTSKKGGDNKDYERVGSEFHRWVRDHHERLGLSSSDAFVRFVERDFEFYGRQFVGIREAARKLTPGLESIRFNDDRTFTVQTQVLLSALTPDDKPEVVKKKLGLVADYLDIWIARRVWNFRVIGQSTIRYAMFSLCKDLRDKDVPNLAKHLRGLLDADTETFASNPDLRLHQQNYRQVRHILARLTYWVDAECGLSTHFEDLISEGRGRPYEIEHLWADKHARFADVFPHPRDFEVARNRLGGLVLLQRGTNQSLGDKPYEEKRDAYVAQGQTLLTRSLHPLAYKNHPSFQAFLDRTGLLFRPYDVFDRQAQDDRQELYLRIAEWVWNPSRLDLDGLKPPVPEPIGVEEEDEGADAEGAPKHRSRRHLMRKGYWTRVLEIARGRSDLHAKVSPQVWSWIGARRDGEWWNYVVTQDHTRVSLYIDGPDPKRNKAVFDALAAHKIEIEKAVGLPLVWNRMDDNRASQVFAETEGGWADEATWSESAERAVSAMLKFYGGLSPFVKKVHASLGAG